MDSDDTAVLTAYLGQEQELTIPETVNGYAVAGIASLAIPDCVTKLTVPVSVSSLADDAVQGEPLIVARFGAPALTWAKEHQLNTTCLTGKRLSALMIDITESDYQKTSQGIIVNAALGKMLQHEQGIYDENSLTGWLVDAVTAQGNGRYLVTVNELDPMFIYEEVVLRSRATASRGVSFDSSGRVVITSNPNRNYPFEAPLYIRMMLITGTANIYNLNFETSFNSVHLANVAARIGTTVGAIAGYVGVNFQDILNATGYGESYADLLQNELFDYFHLEFDLDFDLTARPTNSALGVKVSDIAEVKLSTAIWIPDTPFCVNPFIRLQLQYSDDFSLSLGFKSLHLGFDYRDHDIKTYYQEPNPYVTVNDIYNVCITYSSGFELSLLKAVTIASVSGDFLWELDVEYPFVADYVGTSLCRDVTWNVQSRFNATASIEISPEDAGGRALSAATYRQAEADLGNNFSFGVTFDGGAGIYVSKDFAIQQIDWPLTIAGHQIASGETAHYEFYPTNNRPWVYKELCTRKHAILFDYDIPGADTYYLDGSGYDSLATWENAIPNPSYEGLTFTGWFTEDGTQFIASDFISGYSNPEYQWEGILSLKARWEPVETTAEVVNDYVIRYVDSTGVSMAIEVNGYGLSNPQQWYENAFANYTPLQQYRDLHIIVRIPVDDKYVKQTTYKIDGKDVAIRYIVPDKFSEYNLVVKNDMRGNNSTGNTEAVNTITSIVYGPKVIGNEGGDGLPFLESVYYSDNMKHIANPGGTLIDVRGFTNCPNLSSVRLPPNLTELNTSFHGATALKSIRLPDTLESITNGAFADCGLIEVTIPESVKYIGDSAFAGCTNLRSVYILGALDELGDGAFSGCTSLTSINCRVERLSNFFRGTPNLRTVNLYGSSMQFFGTMCPSDTGVESFTIEADSLTGGDIKLIGLSNLKSVTIRVKQINGNIEISGCDLLQEITIECETCGNITISNLAALTKLSLTHDSSSSMILISNCPALPELSLSGSVEFLNVRNCYAMETIRTGAITNSIYFSGNDIAHLKEVYIGDGTENLSAYARITEFPHLTSISIPSDLDLPATLIPSSLLSQVMIHRRVATSIGVVTNGYTLHFESIFGQENEDWILPAGQSITLFEPIRKGLIFEGWYTSDDHNTLLAAGDTFIMPSKDTTLHASYRTKADLPEDTTVFTGGSQYVYDFQGRKTVIIPAGFIELADKCIGYSTTHVFIPASVTKIGSAFTQAERLSHIEVDPANPNYYSEDGILYTRSGKLVCVPHQMTGDLYLPKNLTGVAANAFYATNSSALTSVHFPDSATDLEDGWTKGLECVLIYGPESGSLHDDAESTGLLYNQFPVFFVDDDSIVAYLMTSSGTELPTINPLVKDGATSLGWSKTPDGQVISGAIKVPFGGLTLYAVWEGFGNSRFTLPLSMMTVEAEAFSGISATSIYIPNGVKAIGDNAFINCTRLTKVRIPASVTVIGNGAFPAGIKIYAPAGSVAAKWAQANGCTWVQFDD